jgi:hypothetical protein
MDQRVPSQARMEMDELNKKKKKKTRKNKNQTKTKSSTNNKKQSPTEIFYHGLLDTSPLGHFFPFQITMEQKRRHNKAMFSS